MALIDCYGHEASSTRYGRREYAKTPYLVVKSGNTTYICFANTEGKQPIHRIREADGVTEIAWAVGRWPERENLDFTTPLGSPIEVDAAELED